MPLRVFVAIPLPLDVKTKLAIVQEAFRSLPLGGAWVRMPGFHITLKFLGEVESVRIGNIVSALKEATCSCEPFSLTLCGLGVFPNEFNPRVLWVGIQDGLQRLTLLQHEIESRLVEIGFPSEERPFTPHLTLARLKRVSGRREFIDRLKTHRGSMVSEIEVHQVELLESQLHPEGARYLTVKALSLRGAADASTVRRDSGVTASFESEKMET